MFLQQTLALTSDRFLVQLTKLDNVPAGKTFSAEEIATMWGKVDKDHMVQFKLRVDLSSDVLQKANNDGADVPVTEKKQEEIKNIVQGEIRDKILKDDR
jgi:hypothetical protein